MPSPEVPYSDIFTSVPSHLAEYLYSDVSCASLHVEALEVRRYRNREIVQGLKSKGLGFDILLCTPCGCAVKESLGYLSIRQ
jgi:hypothetical protein